MYEWALKTPGIAGFIPWYRSSTVTSVPFAPFCLILSVVCLRRHLSNRKMVPRPDCDMALGAVAMPRVMEELRKIGTSIKLGSR